MKGRPEVYVCTASKSKSSTTRVLFLLKCSAQQASGRQLVSGPGSRGTLGSVHPRTRFQGNQGWRASAVGQVLQWLASSSKGSRRVLFYPGAMGRFQVKLFRSVIPDKSSRCGVYGLIRFVGLG